MLSLARQSRSLFEVYAILLDLAVSGRIRTIVQSLRLTMRALGDLESEVRLMAAFSRLVEDGLLVIAGPIKSGEILPPRCRILPTAKALRTIPAYASLNEKEIEAELNKLIH